MALWILAGALVGLSIVFPLGGDAREFPLPPLLLAAAFLAIGATGSLDPGVGTAGGARHGFGRGEYGYFAYPLPEPVARLRAALYPPLATVANRWAEALGSGVQYPGTHDAFLARCRDAGQSRPTPLLLRYGAGDYNCLHQDLYGEHVFPLQVAILLAEPGVDFDGGEFVLTEQRPRMQSRVSVVPLRRGEHCLKLARQTRQIATPIST